jgi:chemotaxis protein CheD
MSREGPIVQILPGGWHVARGEERISTVLGSCVAACIRDVRLGLGGMNHFMLPEPRGASSASNPWLVSEPARYGSFAMERLCNRLIGRGAAREHLEVKIFGGGKMFDGMNDVGAQNVEFVRRYLAVEGLRLAAEDVGGEHGRQVIFDPRSGVALVRRIGRTQEATLAGEEAKLRRAPPPGGEGTVELWEG